MPPVFRNPAPARAGLGVPPARGKPAEAPADSTQSFSLRLFGAGLASAELMTCYLGLELGLYEALRRTGPATAAQVAEDGGLDARMVREWLEQQTCAGVLTVDAPEAPPADRRFTLPPAHAEALLDSGSPNWIAPLVVMPIGGMAAVLPQLVDAYRGRRGLPYAAYGEALRGGQAGLNQGVFAHHLPGWIGRHLPDIDARLRVPGSSIADVACGSGLSTLALARMFPDAEVHGLDLDEASIRDAEANLAAADPAEGLGERVRFHAGDAAQAGDGAAAVHTLVCVFDALHDMSAPVDVLRACRRLLAPGGAVLLMEPSVGERFTPAAPDSERFHYAVSVLHCLPVGMSRTPSAATGTVMRPDTVRRYAAEAGLDTRVIDVGHPFHRLYRLTATP
ncbi:2-polyprenyl-3-methyl-5-hydroxy-6-metoxy-1,4-benzoquinol methylase [Streptomyces sp. KhCrAH-43]|uniref:class I SAM-dependent methyltransferase n=1 Tax=unclassified Streptomyces TaxID=2593676 RepID=UPI00037A9B64|nr:class I SAM-dependent methyltransferase [Streptomyces sp. KhCrAH-43]RAJ48725.1 2-polyprenyl-3-methyl-5-hydroxy-6-metoxy-1,4-benzoquinol methylase [Streptomyces sp. KhCrAH-43]